MMMTIDGLLAVGATRRASMRKTMTRTSGARFLISAAAIAGTLVIWVSLAQVESEPPTMTAADPPDEVIDVTASASGRRR